MPWNVWGVGGISPLFHNITGVGGGGGIPPEEGGGIGLVGALKTSLLLANGQLPQSDATAIGLIMNVEF